MQQFTELLFLLNLAWIATHELDAIRQEEWRVLPLTSWLNETWGYPVFVLLHIPLFVLVFVGIPMRNFQIGMDMFLIIHGGLHILFRHHSDYHFDNRLSQILIFGVIPFALAHLLLIL